MTRRFYLAGALLCACLPLGAQSYSSGQPLSPAYEGWEKNADGSFNLVFGYMNSNWEQEIDVPIGPLNNFSPGPADQGQPTHFFPRRNRFVFRVKVPKDFGTKELVWTVTANGKTIKAYGTLKEDYYVDNMIFTSETGAIGAGVSNPAIRANKPPTAEAVGETVRTVKVGEPLTLSVLIKDDGIPKPRQRDVGATGRRAGTPEVTDLRMIPPRQITVGSSTGLWCSLLVYRGDGPSVHISPDQVKSWEDTRAGANSQWAPRWVAPPAPADGKWTATAVFDEPGSYTLRWHASDGALWADQDIKVTVTK
jgi:hypothetical protein